jgi:DNA-binding IclR family transcriptional regulator
LLGTVEKAARVLELFTDGKPEWGVTEVGRALDLPKSSAHSIVSALADAGFLDRTERNRYRLGLQMLTLSRAVLDSSPALVHVDSAMHTLVQRYGVTVHIGGLDDDQGIYLDKARGRGVKPPQPERHRRPSVEAMELGRVPSAVGRRFPCHATALGKVLLAHAPSGTAERMIERRGLPALTTATNTSPDVLLDELKTIRERGWAVSREEGVPDVCCYAAGIVDDGRVDVAISISVTADEDRARPAQYAQLAQAAGRMASRRLREDRSWVAAADMALA